MRPDDDLYSFYRWEHLDKRRYYELRINKDFFGDWVITKIWGGINQATGRIMHFACQNREAVEKTILTIKKTREKHGYLCVHHVS